MQFLHSWPRQRFGVMRELPEAESGGGVVFVVGDPEVVLARHRANRLINVSAGAAQPAAAVGVHTDLAIAEPK